MTQVDTLAPQLASKPDLIYIERTPAGGGGKTSVAPSIVSLAENRGNFRDRFRTAAEHDKLNRQFQRVEAAHEVDHVTVLSVPDAKGVEAAQINGNAALGLWLNSQFPHTR